ncbi:hypothetical protein P4S72_22405 [Vibrio sp. PP-XX7]
MPIDRLDDCHAPPLSGKAIRQLLSNQILLTKDCFNIPYRVTFQADGKMTGVSERPNDIDEGYWWIEKISCCINGETGSFPMSGK